MSHEEGDIKTFNPSKEISREITLEILIRHRDSLKQARTGELVGVPIDNISDNVRKFNQVRALNLIIAAQREMITVSRPLVFFRAMRKWEKEVKTDEEREKLPFNQHKNDYTYILKWLEFLKDCEEAILKAEKTKRIDDDFMIKKISNEGEIFELTPNFREMLDDLEHSYEQIYLLMLTNKIVSSGIDEDEEKTTRELEDEMMRRVEEA